MLGNFFKATAHIAIKPVLAVVSDIQIRPSVVIIVADTDALAPAGAKQSCFCGDVRKGPVMIVMVKVVCGRACGGKALPRGSVYHEKIRPALLVVVEDSRPGSRPLPPLN